ncbi:PREDICTED: reverse mRNAase [Prunus dulcis]|uniref:PREDICTED: reverse mRNAase n=1 Tax=Prunus dulcis TaxID=3755 RepID=A0A5E4GDB5_PRUDU|nr:PREDICTED: reverse mRNAase [Prunus dulcis]
MGMALWEDVPCGKTSSITFEERHKWAQSQFLFGHHFVTNWATLGPEQLPGPIINVDLAFDKMGFKREAEPGWKEVGKEGNRRKVMSRDNEAEKGHTKGSKQRSHKVAMSYIFQNYQGLGSDLTVRSLRETIRKKRPSIVFVMETKQKHNRLSMIAKEMGFNYDTVVDPEGIAGALCLWWDDIVKLKMSRKSKNLIHTRVEFVATGVKFRASWV